MPASSIQNRPTLPKPISLPLGLLPNRLHSAVLGRALNRVFAEDIVEAELDFLEGKVVEISILDAKTAFSVEMDAGSFRSAAGKPSDLKISGTVYDFLLLLTGQEDPDTLFFQRHLLMEGDTGLGVHLKNFLAGVDLESLPLATMVNPALLRCVSMYERFA